MSPETEATIQRTIEIVDEIEIAGWLPPSVLRPLKAARDDLAALLI